MIKNTKKEEVIIALKYQNIETFKITLYDAAIAQGFNHITKATGFCLKHLHDILHPISLSNHDEIIAVMKAIGLEGHENQLSAKFKA